MWFPQRGDLSRMGVHRPPMAGISGSAREPADSIVVSGGYEDDEDDGDVLVYTGQGGNDPLTKKQVCDQDLNRGNRGLVLSLMEGLPVRVVRGANLGSPFAPEAGYRYDGLFRVEAYWHEPGISGFRVWRFRLGKIKPIVARPRSISVAETSALYGAQAVGEPAARQSLLVSRIVRNSAVAITVKRLHRFACQVCGTCLETPAGPYAEAAHIRPLGTPHDGPDTAENVLCLCPNHHALFDLGGFTIEDDLRLTGTRARLRTVRAHPISPDHLRYHRAHYRHGSDDLRFVAAAAAE